MTLEVTKRVSKDNIENKPRIGEGLKNFKTTYKTTTIDNDLLKSRKFKIILYVILT